jgi:MinD-like ATPase involved in chromosome partitioning or flagellar assembly
VAKNDQDKSGRSLEEQLASLDAMSSGDSDEPQQEGSQDQITDQPSPGTWATTPPAPSFPPPFAAAPPDPPRPPAEGAQPYGYGPAGYPPHEFGVHQPPQFPGNPAQDYGGYPGYPPAEPAQHYDAAPNGSHAHDTPQPPAREPEPPYNPADTERTQFVERQRPPVETTRTDGGQDPYTDGGYQPYPPYPGQQHYPQEQSGPYSSPQYFQAPPPEQGATYPPSYGEQHAPYPEPQQYPPQGDQQGQPYPRQYEAEQGPPLAPLPDAYASQQQGAAQTADSLSAETLLRGRRNAPAGGWRRALYKASGGVIHPGESPNELRRRELLARARTPVAGGHHRVAVMSLKGGVGKTTTTVGLGATLASVRGDRVIAVDANPDRGTLSDKVRLETATTVRDLLNEHRQIQRYADVRAYTSQASSRLEVLASDRDPAVSEAFSEDDYRTVAHVLEHFYSICLTDCGTGLLHSAMAGVLGLANQLVLVSSPSVDGARSASATLDWLEAHHYGDLVRGGVVVLSMVRSRSRSTVDLDRLQAHFESRCRAVVRIPYDPHLEEGAEVELDQLSPATQDAYLMLAAMVGDGFAWPR